MENSILISTKHILGLDASYVAFDLDVLTFINTSLSKLNQLGVFETEMPTVESASELWTDLDLSVHMISMVKAYVFLNVRMSFDPPATSYHITAAKEQIQELEWRISTYREVELP